MHAAFFTPLSGGRWGLPIVFEGIPGIAKSSLVRDFAAKCEVPLHILDASSGEGAYGVIPMPMDHKGVLSTRYPIPEWAVDMLTNDVGVVFVDELTSTPPLIQAAQMALILDRRIGGHTLPQRVRILGACNPTDQATYGHEIAAPLANRCVWVHVDPPSVEEHASYMMGLTSDKSQEKVSASQEEARVLAEWPKAWATAVGLEIGFLSRNQGYKNGVPTDTSGQQKKGSDIGIGIKSFPSDRSWEAATRAIATGIVHNLSTEETNDLIAGCIGSTAMNLVRTYQAECDLPDTSNLLDGKVSFTHSQIRPDRSAAVISSCTALVIPKSCPNREKRASALWKLLESLQLIMKDLAIPATKALVDNGLVRPEGVKVLASVEPILSASKVR
jgi:hypothetical protein